MKGDSEAKMFFLEQNLIGYISRKSRSNHYSGRGLDCAYWGVLAPNNSNWQSKLPQLLYSVLLWIRFSS